MQKSKKIWIILILLIFAALAIFVLIKRPPIRVPLLQLPTAQLPSTPCSDGSCPSEIFDLTDWKLTLPITGPSNPNTPLEIDQPQLAKYDLSPWFTPTTDHKALLFRAAVNGTTTPNTAYARSELREMTANGTQDAAWPSTSGTHTLFIDEAITAVPQNKPSVVVGQIHGDSSDTLVIRLDYPTLFVDRGAANVFTLDNNYVLGKRFTVKFVATGGQIMVYYNGSTDPVYTLQKKIKKAYFKVGVYTQSNCATEGSPDLCNNNNYGEVAVYQATVTHQ